MNIIDVLVIVVLLGFVITRFMTNDLPIDQTLKNKKKARPLPKVVDFPKQPEEDNGKVPGLADLKKADPSFREKDFLAGAKKAYQYFYKKWNQTDDEALSNLVSPQLLNTFIEELNALDEKEHTPEIAVKGIHKVEILEAKLHGQSAIIEVQFTAEQAENVKDADGNYIGKEQKPKEIKSVWTFARPLTAEDPNWSVEAITKPH